MKKKEKILNDYRVIDKKINSLKRILKKENILI